MKKRKTLSVIDCFVLVLLLFFAITYLSGMLWVLLASVKSDVQYYMAGTILQLPKPVTIGNYYNAFIVLKEEGYDLLNMIFNSVWFSIGAVVLTVFFNSAMAYVLTKYRFPGCRLLYVVYFVTMMIPIVGNMPSSLRMYKTLHIYNTPLMLITRASAGGANLFILMSCYKGVSMSYSEAAFLDGGGHFTVYFKVIFPQAAGMMLAMGVMGFISTWNDYMTPLVYYRDYPTLASGIYRISLIAERWFWEPYMFAAIVISAIPLVVIFAVFQKTLLQIDIGGGIKG